MSNSNQLHVEIISPSGVVFDGNCHMVTIPGTNGDLGIMNNHEPTLAKLREGKISLFDKDQKLSKEFDIVSGFANNVENKLLILVDK
jgi:F-type H+-transporting ATPase subunit epsilon